MMNCLELALTTRQIWHDCSLYVYNIFFATHAIWLPSYAPRVRHHMPSI